MLGEIDVEINSWRGINISGFGEILEVQTEKVFKRKFTDETLQSCIQSRMANRISRRNVQLYEPSIYEMEKDDTTYIVIICVSSTLTVIVLFVLVAVIWKYFQLRRRLNDSNSDFLNEDEMDTNCVTGTDTTAIDNPHITENNCNTDPSSMIRSHAKIPVHKYSKRIFRKETRKKGGRVSFSNNIHIFTIPKD